jgi:cell division septal protein FtsQ
MQIYSDKKAAARRKRIFRIKIYFLIFFAALVLFGIYYVLIYSSVFRVKAITVNNNRFFSESDILEMLRPVVLSGKIGSMAGFDNLFSWSSGKITVSNLAITDIDIEKNWFQRTINANVDERQRFAIWCFNAGQDCYWMDKQGIIFTEAPSTEGSLVSVVFDSRNEDLALGSGVEDDRFMGNLISILENLDTLDLQIDKINFNNDLQELIVSTVGGPTITFGLRFDSAKNLSLIKDLNYKNLKFIDLSVENRIYIPSK